MRGITIYDRIKECVRASGLNQTKFGERINLSSGQVSQMCSGGRNPSLRTVKDICREFNISETWLLTGEGEMFEKQLPQNVLAAKLDKIITAGPDDFRRRLISVLVQLPQEKWTVLEEIARDLADSAQYAAAPHEETPEEYGDRMRELAIQEKRQESEASNSPDLKDGSA